MTTTAYTVLVIAAALAGFGLGAGFTAWAINRWALREHD